MYAKINDLFISKLSKHPEVTPVTSQEYSRGLMDLVCADDYDPKSTFHFANSAMFWVDKLQRLVHVANRMPRPPMCKEMWITKFESILREKSIHFVPSIATRHLSAKRIKRVIHPVKRSTVQVVIHPVKRSRIQVVIPVRQGTQRAAPARPNEQSHTLLPRLGFTLSPTAIPPELIREHKNEIERLESKPCQKSTVLMKLFREAYETLDLSLPYHRVLITIGRILILSTPIPIAEPGKAPLQWETSHDPKKDKYRWLYLFVILGLHHVNPRLQAQSAKENKKFIKAHFGLCYCNVS